MLRFDATGRLHFVSTRPAASSFPCPACGFTEEKRQRAGAVQDAARGPEAIGKRASVLDCGGPPPLSIQGVANRFSLCRFRGRSGFGLLNLMGCSPHSVLRAQKIYFPEYINL